MLPIKQVVHLPEEETSSVRVMALAELLVGQPVVDVSYVGGKLGISHRAAQSLVARSCSRGILKKMGNAQRGAFYAATALIDILEKASSLQGIRRMVAR